jgi:hypothetical protein
MMLNKNLQEINIQNMDTELVAQMFKNYQSNVLFHLEGRYPRRIGCLVSQTNVQQLRMDSRTQHSCSVGVWPLIWGVYTNLWCNS